MARQEPFLDLDGDEDGPAVYRRRQTRTMPEYDDGYDEATDWDQQRWGVMDRLLAAPGHLAMTVVALAAFGIVAVNAAYRQPGAHPAPILSTRAEAPAQTISDTSIGDLQRQIANAPAPSLPPQRLPSGEVTASIVGTEGQSAVRAPYAAPAPLPRPQTFAVTTPSSALPSPVRQPAPVPVTTIAVNDPIGALLAPVIASQPAQTNPQVVPGQTGPSPVATRSAQPIVAAVQTILSELGYQPGSIDGVVGPSTEESIRRFQLRRGLEPNGQITNELLREIERVTGQRMTAS